MNSSAVMLESNIQRQGETDASYPYDSPIPICSAEAVLCEIFLMLPFGLVEIICLVYLCNDIFTHNSSWTESSGV